ncbi:hypothetical protein F4808DRAFT_462745 [Astrocystis sublimbata]|nr:hypothetical protein F4808DRAFT_462745 [Astrocystis sublimbata]
MWEKAIVNKPQYPFHKFSITVPLLVSPTMDAIHRSGEEDISRAASGVEENTSRAASAIDFRLLLKVPGFVVFMVDTGLEFHIFMLYPQMELLALSPIFLIASD